MKILFYQIDAFSRKIFGGNPAAVCLLGSWLADDALQAIAAENNLSETAFLVPRAEGLYDLRWFTPAVEIDLYGHATLASAFVIFSFIHRTLSSVDFKTASGLLTVAKSGELLSMDFPGRKPVPTGTSAILSRALGAEPVEVLKSRDLLVVFENESSIKNINPDFDTLKQIRDAFGIIVTAQGDKSDFVSRFFAPNAGISEDPVTGSAHCTLIPY
jgi:PhzF family phenazine biosynthesis protein